MSKAHLDCNNVNITEQRMPVECQELLQDCELQRRDSMILSSVLLGCSNLQCSLSVRAANPPNQAIQKGRCAVEDRAVSCAALQFPKLKT